MLEHNPLWDFSLAVYQKATVSEDCLILQDQWGVDINILLCTYWLGSCGHRLLIDECGRLIAECESWREDVVLPLRHIRRNLKTKSPMIYEQAKALELAVERWQHDTLYRICKTFIQTDGWDRLLIRDNSRCYLQRFALGQRGEIIADRIMAHIKPQSE